MNLNRLVLEFGSPGRSISDDGWERIDAADVQAWRDATTELSSFDLGDVGRFATIDWSPMVVRYETHLATMREVYSAKGTPEAALAVAKFPSGPVRIDVGLDGPELTNTEQNQARNSLESILYDVFATLNLAVPGSCDFSRVTVGASGHRFPIQFSLSNVFFELAYLHGHDGKWPKPQLLELRTASRWVSSVCESATRAHLRHALRKRSSRSGTCHKAMRRQQP